MTRDEIEPRLPQISARINIPAHHKTSKVQSVYYSCHCARSLKCQPMLLNPSSLHLTRGLPKAGFILSSYFLITPVVVRSLACGADRNNKLIHNQAQSYQSLSTPGYCRAASTVQKGSDIPSSTSSKKVGAAMAPAARPDLEKQYMSSTPKSKKQDPEPRPSSRHVAALYPLYISSTWVVLLFSNSPF